MRATLALGILLTLISCSKNSQSTPGSEMTPIQVSSIVSVAQTEVSKLNELVGKIQNHQISIEEINMLHSEGVITETEKEELLKLASTK